MRSRLNYSAVLFLAVLAGSLGVLSIAGAQRAAAQNAPAPVPPRLTLADAEALALKNHPQIQAAQDEAAFLGQQVVEARSAYYPALDGDLTGSQGNANSRIGAGSLTASRLFNRFGQGIVVQQLITDFGRTRNLVAASRLQAEATDETLHATRADVLLQVNRAYFQVLAAQTLVKVAEQTVAARQLLDDQVSTLARNSLRSQLDVSFADVNVSQAKLLLLQAQEALQQAFAELGRAIGSDLAVNYELVDEPLPAAPPSGPDELIAQAMDNRPELASLRYARDAAYKFFYAERDLSRPTINLVGVAGALPLINSSLPTEYEGGAVNVDIPIFNGGLFSARREAARYRALESDQRLRNEQIGIVRDVRVVWATGTTAYQRIDVTAQFLRQASLALDLARGRYNLGLSDIVALTQAQLNVTQAEIDNLNAKYDYHTQYALIQYTMGLLH